MAPVTDARKFLDTHLIQIRQHLVIWTDPLARTRKEDQSTGSEDPNRKL